MSERLVGGRGPLSRGATALAAAVGVLALTAAPVSALPSGGGKPPLLDPADGGDPKSPCPEHGQVREDMRYADMADFVARHESTHGRDGDTHVYVDSRGNPTVGVGFNLNRSDARAKLAAVGANYDEVRAGRQDLNRYQIDVLFTATLVEATNDARALVPTFDALNGTRQAVLIDMVFNMGRAKLAEFSRFLAAIAAGDWKTAAAEMTDSTWAGQVGGRARTDTELMRTGYICTPTPHPVPVSPDIRGVPYPGVRGGGGKFDVQPVMITGGGLALGGPVPDGALGGHCFSVINTGGGTTYVSVTCGSISVQIHYPALT